MQTDTRQRTERIRAFWPSHRFGPKNHEWLAIAMRLGGKGRIEAIEEGAIGWRIGAVEMRLVGGRPVFQVEGASDE